MKRIGNLYSQVYDIDNLILADHKARKGKSKQVGVRSHDKNRDMHILMLHESLKNKTFRNSNYHVFTITDPKEREIFRLPYYPDRIVHHAIMNVLEKIFVSSFTRDTYSCIKKRGIHGAFKAVQLALKDEVNTQYCLKLDVKKFYPSIDHDILKKLLRRKFKDPDLLWLLDEIISSTPGVPIGNYLSQFFANFYVSGFDHWMKEKMEVLNYMRYCDDMVIFAPDKESLHVLFQEIRVYLLENLKLTIKSNYQVFPVNKRGVDVLGYKFFHKYILLRKSIKRKFIIMIKRRRNEASVNAYGGWIKHCDGKNLLKKYL